MRSRGLIALAVAAAVAATLPLPEALRLVAVLPFLFFGPGLAFVWLCRLRDPFAEVVVAVALSMAIDIAVAEPLILAGAWSAPAAIGTLAALTVVGARFGPLTAEGGIRATRRRPRGPA